MIVHYHLSDSEPDFHMAFQDGAAGGALGAPEGDADVILTMSAELLDGMLTGRTNAVRAAMTGKLSFGGDSRQAMSQQQIQGDLVRLYVRARREALGGNRHGEP
jgi:putative sterol carrier protein